MADPDAEVVERDPHFSSSERLFRRIPPEDVRDGSISDASLPSPSFSVNREKYSTAEDVVKGYPGFRVAAFRVGDIPPSVSSDTGESYQFGVEHEPLADNFAHSEVNSYLAGAKLRHKPPRPVRKKFRDLLRRKIEILEV
jgi:hypothetical protein